MSAPDVAVHIDVGGVTLRAGVAYFTHGRQRVTTSFAYDPAYHPDAKRVSKHRVISTDGSVIVNFVPDGASDVKLVTQEPRSDVIEAATSYVEGCPTGKTQKWFCFYKDSNYKGRMLQFKDCAPVFGVKQNLADYG